MREIPGGLGWRQLTSANYIEHFGLLRRKGTDGRYERCRPWHSWNANHLASNLVLFHLQRRSDHPAWSARHYQTLRDFDDVPQLPSGYFRMPLLALAKGDPSRINLDPRLKTP